mgnify:CR=1 FL=1
MNSNSNIDKQKARLDFLIQILLKETDYKIKIPDDIKEKHIIYKSLCNMRTPYPLSKDFFQIEKEYLQERLKSYKITDIDDIQPLRITHPFLSQTKKYKNLDNICLWKGDITKLKIDANLKKHKTYKLWIYTGGGYRDFSTGTTGYITEIIPKEYFDL